MTKFSKADNGEIPRARKDLKSGSETKNTVETIKKETVHDEICKTRKVAERQISQ